MGDTSTSIEDLVANWLSMDVNPITRQEIIELQRSGNVHELEQRLRGRILFGTAGLRARMEAGFTRMNDVTVLQASQGLASYILKQKFDEPSIVIGHDHRHNSERFAFITASVFILKKIKVYFLGNTGLKVIPTPLVPFTVDYYHSSCGVMITASHNPAADNGYKVYWGNGCQIIPPHDRLIQDEIMKNLNPWENCWNLNENIKIAILEKKFQQIRDLMIENYISSIEKKLIKNFFQKSLNGKTKIKVVYTPMHGVGLEIVEKIIKKHLKFVELIITTEQAKMDPDFNTVKFPNPEEKGALDLAIQTANSIEDCNLVLANDPDADRFSVAIKYQGSWKQLTGNEIGLLFADYVISQFPLNQLNNIYILNSTVSSQMIKSMASKLGFHYLDTLTGFKWIGNKAIDLEKSGFQVPFAYEEAIGFMFPVVHDKDGISALIVFLQMYKSWLFNNTNGIEKLKESFEKFGFFKECNGYYIVPDTETTPYIFNQIIRNSKPYPTTIGTDFIVTQWRDLTFGYDSATPNHKPQLPVDNSSQMITCVLKPTDSHSHIVSDEEFVRFTARGSGTEPKLKVYIEGKASTEQSALELAQRAWQSLKTEWFKPSENHLIEKV
ncbi:hypothetical protein PACTADRAFT_34969 [Pachysolen tannophilus NRRL Y-2460]|uniref:Phosphoribomutase n=1 Tax=Pachysolen tannophilus NRRL Y-2460 TaxID=669874 RepID=A0A1E4TR07_PACTA|nr:hypothetical protein PACTADRAFT_34969 [Pachysolen tannophilus NRRL Y-2460]